MTRIFSASANNLSFDYQITRSRRKTLGLYVKEGQVEVRTPHHINHADIHVWVADKSEWVLDRLKEQQLKEHEKPDISSGGHFLFLGNQRSIEFISGTPAIFEKDDQIIIARRPKTNINKLLEKWLKEEAQLYLNERVLDIAELMQESQRIQEIQFRKTKSKWGHCTSKGVLQFNWLIIMAPPDVIDYLIVHEVSHLQHMNHSKSFWQRVEVFCPDYKAQRHWLKANGHKLWID